MKKFLMVAGIALLVGTAAFADHEGTGLGLVVNAGWGGWGGYGAPGFSLKVPALPIFWGIYVYPGSRRFGVGVTGDFYIIDNNLVTNEMTNEDGSYNFKLDWYLGVGAFLDAHFVDKGYWDSWYGVYYPDGYRRDRYHRNNFAVGVRVPVGLSWHIVRQFEIALGVAPGLGVGINNDGAWFVWRFPVEFAMRYWIANNKE